MSLSLWGLMEKWVQHTASSWAAGKAKGLWQISWLAAVCAAVHRSPCLVCPSRWHNTMTINVTRVSPICLLHKVLLLSLCVCDQKGKINPLSMMLLKPHYRAMAYLKRKRAPKQSPFLENKKAWSTLILCSLYSYLKGVFFLASWKCATQHPRLLYAHRNKASSCMLSLS